MILRRYGTSVQSVDLNFDSRALSEIGFRRNKEHSEPVDAFMVRCERVSGHDFSGQADGSVQSEVERRLLKDMESEILRIHGGLGLDEVLLIESEQGIDYPKTRTRTVIVDGENRLRFTASVHPPLRVGVYRKRRALG